MIQITNKGVQTNYDIDAMLYETMKWLVGLTRRKTTYFLEVANQIELDQSNWDMFWKELRKEKEQLKLNK